MVYSIDSMHLRGQPFDSWGGGGGGVMLFCEKKDCSANIGK